MALTKPSTVYPKGYQSYGDFLVTSGVKIYQGALVALEFGTGTIDNLNDEPGHVYIGRAQPSAASVTGDGSSVTCPVLLDGAQLLPSATVTGASAATDNLEPVYATDEDTLTLSRPADDAAVVGVVLRHVSGTSCDVLMFDILSSVILGLAGGNKRREFLGSIHTTQLESSAAATLITGITMPAHGRFVGFEAQICGFDAGYTAGSQVINLEIGGTNVSGSSLTINKDDMDALSATAALVATSAISDSTNEFHEGDLVDIELQAAAAAIAPGGIDITTINLFAYVEYLPGA